MAFVPAVFLAAAFFPAGAPAGEKPAVSLERAIRTVKENFTVPQEFTRFTSGYSGDHDRQAWSLNWNAPEEPGGSFHARVDAQSGEILNLEVWKPERRREPGLRVPAVPEAQARQTAEALLKRLIPKYLADLQFTAAGEQPIPLRNYGMFAYSFRWQRMVSGIPFPGNGVTVEVGAGDGQVTSYRFDWRKGDFPSAAGAISPEKAQQAFEQAGMLELQYFFPSPVRPLAAKEEQKQRAQLVYRLYHPSGGLIDATSGKPLEPPGRWFGNDAGGGPGGAEMQKMMDSRSGAPVPVPLSPEEIKEIERSAKIISKEAAAAAVKRRKKSACWGRPASSASTATPSAPRKKSPQPLCCGPC